MSRDFDIIVIGSGAGGGTLAYACAKAGKRVLVLERGRKFVVDSLNQDEQATLIDKSPYDDRAIKVNGQAKRLYMGGVVGGGTSVFGGAMLRPSREDFHPGKFYGDRIPRSIWDWPIAYDHLEPFFDEAENLYQVAGDSEDDFGPLGAPQHGFNGENMPLTPINQRLIRANRARGLKPFRLPLAIDGKRCLRCDACAGFACPNGSRRSSGQLIEQAMADNLCLQVFENAEVERLERSSSCRIAGVRVRDRVTGKAETYTAERYVLGAGAIGSSTILLRSGFTHSLIGRNYMMHLSPVSIGIFPASTGADETFVKQVGFADFYFGEQRHPQKMGIIQSLPAPGPLMLAKVTAGRLPRRLALFLRRRMLPMCGIVEDLPNPENCVTINSSGNIDLRHSYGPYDLERGRQLTRWMKLVLKRAGAMFCISRAFPSSEHVAHQCGTTRFGTQPEHAVVDADCRMFGQPDVFVVDGGILPTSLGVGPSLTIIANALRVAQIVSQET